jgi:hypothetical protein
MAVSFPACQEGKLLGAEAAGEDRVIVTAREEVSLPELKRLYNGLGNITEPDVGKVGKPRMS